MELTLELDEIPGLSLVNDQRGKTIAFRLDDDEDISLCKEFIEDAKSVYSFDDLSYKWIIIDGVLFLRVNKQI